MEDAAVDVTNRRGIRCFGPKPSALLALAVLVGCGNADVGEARADQAPAADRQEAGPPAATLTLGDASYSFPTASCDLADSQGTGMLVRARGKAPDGRSTTLEVERLKRGDTVHETVGLTVGNRMSGEYWTARADGWPDGRWVVPGPGGETLEGRLIVVSGTTVTAEGTFSQEKTEGSRSGSLRVDCGG